MGKIVITYDDAIRKIDALDMVKLVIAKELASEARRVKKHCNGAVFGYDNNASVIVHTEDRREAGGPDSFDVRFQ